jgi:transcriptional regulator with XRE-family HTH domain
MIPIRSFLGGLEKRRKELGMPWDALVARSGVPRATVIRLLKDRHAAAAFQTVVAVAEALGVPFAIDGDSIHSVPVDVDDFLQRQADRQARKLVGMVQGTMGLESQALAEAAAASLVKKTKRRLLAGSKRKLWYE